MAEADQENGFVREKLFNERTKNIKASIEALDETVKEALRLFKEGQAEQDEKIRDNSDQLASVCQRIDEEAEGEEAERKDETLRIARWAMVISVISVSSTLCLGVLGFLKLIKVI